MPIAGNRATMVGGGFARAVKFSPDANCVLWFPGQDDSPSVTIRDRSGTGNHGTIAGATWVILSSGLLGLSFDGSNDWASMVGNSLAIVGDLTLEAWVKGDTTQTDTLGSIVRAQNPYLAYLRNDGKLAFQQRDEVASAWRAATSTNAVTNLVFNHIVFTRVVTTNSEVLMYVNGALFPANATTLTGMPGATTTYYKFGGYNATTERLKGVIAMLCICTRALSSIEVANHYNQERHLFGV